MRRSSASRLLFSAAALGLVLTAAAGGCANLIGLDDYEEVDGKPRPRSTGGRDGGVNATGGRASGGNPSTNTGGRAPSTGGRAPATGGQQGTGDRCDFPGFERPCLDCVADRCANECAGCNGNPDCVALLACFQECAGTTDCLSDCGDAYPGGVDPFLEVWADYSCAFTTCKLECQGTLGALGESCDTNAQCEGGFCAGVDGWCTTFCEGSFDCHVGGACVVNEADTSTCFMGCITDADCVLYPGTVCGEAESVEGDPVTLCMG
jgi:hypothetical protein